VVWKVVVTLSWKVPVGSRVKKKPSLPSMVICGVTPAKTSVPDSKSKAPVTWPERLSWLTVNGPPVRRIPKPEAPVRLKLAISVALLGGAPAVGVQFPAVAHEPNPPFQVKEVALAPGARRASMAAMEPARIDGAFFRRFA